MRLPSHPTDKTMRRLWLSSLTLATLLALCSSEAAAGSEATRDSAVVGFGFGAQTHGLEQQTQTQPGQGGDTEIFELGAPLWEPGELDPATGSIGRWQRELQRRRDLLVRHRGRDHVAALALLGLLPVLSGEVERADLVALVDGVREDRRRHPLVRALAADIRGALHEDAGELAEARALYAEQGRLLSWRIIGPFDNANRTGHDQVYGPEREDWAPAQSFEGKLAGEPLDWRPYEPENAMGGGYISFDEFLRPNEYVSAYATTWVHAAKASEAVLHVGTGGAHKIWVGTQLVGEGKSYRRPTPLQEAYAIELEAGWNRVLVKVGCEAGAWGFFARVSAKDGSPIPDVQASGSPPVDATKLPTGAPGAHMRGTGEGAGASATELAVGAKAPLSLRKLFEDAADEDVTRRVAPEDELALSELYSWVTPFSREDFTARDQAREADAALESPRSALFLALAEDDSARARTAFELGVERAQAAGDSARAEHSQMLIELAYSSAALGLERRAQALLDDARRVAPDDALIELAHLEQLSSDGFELATMSWLEDLRQRYPNSATIQAELASREIGLGRVREGLALLEQHSKAHSGDAAVIEQRIEAHLRLGEVEPAVGLARDMVASSPGRPSAWRRLAGLEEAAGNYALAVAALETAVELAPQDPQLHTALGFLQSRAGDQGGSVLAFQRSLELNPQQPELRDLLTTLGAAADDVFTRYAVELEDVVAAAAEAPEPASWQGKDAAVLHRMIATRIGPSGLGERLDHRIVKILDERGIESQARHDFGYEPSESYVEVRRARVHRADGRVEDIGITRHYSVGAAGYRMYYDQRGVAVQFPGLRVGDVIEVAFVRRDVATRNMFDNYYGDLIPLQGVEPTRHLEYLLEAPADLKLHFNQALDASEGDGDSQTTVYRLTRDDLAGLRSEGGMPGWTEVAEYLHVSTYATWDEVGRWYWGLVEGQLLVDDAIQAGVAAALASLPKDASERDKVAALYRHVIRETRYVGLEFGIHGYKPYRTTDIYNRRFGDCKDKASLLKVMLGEIGVTSHLVLVRTRDQGAIADSPASLSAFNHAIVYVPKYDLFMDGTAEHSGAFELPAGDQGASVVVIEDGKGASFKTIPYATPDQNYSEYTLDVRLESSGDAAVDHDMTLVGTGAASWRGTLEAKEQRVEQLTKQLSRTFPGIEVRSARFPNIDEILAPVRVEAKLSIPGWAQVQGGQGRVPKGLRWRVLGHEVELLRSIAPQARREQTLVLGVPNREVRTIHYMLPRGLDFSHSPQASRIDSPFGRFELEVETRAREATVKTTLEFSRPRVEASEYEAFRDFLREVDAALAQAFEATPAG